MARMTGQMAHQLRSIFDNLDWMTLPAANGKKLLEERDFFTEALTAIVSGEIELDSLKRELRHKTGIIKL